ncbi:hypothetical protein H9L15_06190 [Sphingomonas daechungensis]|uniref:Uncharacterized protein n=1 Tax=Sphingomonas daechungensis TaxID=1176646 RepID=A0ABX6T2M0_9SPHN|nr:hypothetical protein H9L15_06190 [Sphingomonas daechungensis]
MARTALFAVGLAAAALLAAIPDARAQCRLCDKPVTAPRADSSGEIIELQIEASLDFDRLVVLGDGEGTATLLPNGTRQTSGSVEAMGGRAMVGEAHIRGSLAAPFESTCHRVFSCTPWEAGESRSTRSSPTCRATLASIRGHSQFPLRRANSFQRK